MARNQTIEICYSLSGFVRLVAKRSPSTGDYFFVQSKVISGEGKLGDLVAWKNVAGGHYKHRLIRFMETYVGGCNLEGLIAQDGAGARLSADPSRC